MSFCFVNMGCSRLTRRCIRWLTFSTPQPESRLRVLRSRQMKLSNALRAAYSPVGACLIQPHFFTQKSSAKEGVVTVSARDCFSLKKLVTSAKMTAMRRKVI
jgi:hypothetical protein